MSRAVFFTAFDRPEYLRRTLESWEAVRGTQAWDFFVFIEPSPVQDEIKTMFEKFFWLNSIKGRVTINGKVLGVLHHPWVCFEELFTDNHYDFVVRAEDDLVVSDDILEYFTWTSREYATVDSVAAVNAFSFGDGDASQVRLVDKFSSWTWGTWRDRWERYIGPTWDHDYSTWTDQPGHLSGWDWNLDLRVLPGLGKKVVRPTVSRTNNIGVHGVHGTAENFVQSEHFSAHQPPMRYYESR